LGVPVAINPDAHSIRGLSDIAYGVMTARKGWIEPHDTLNNLTGVELEERMRG
jgi:DNA polymerase (family 10)